MKKYIFILFFLVAGCDLTTNTLQEDEQIAKDDEQVVEDDEQPSDDDKKTTDDNLQIPGDWIKIEPDSIFFFMAPPDVVDQEAAGIDSFVGLYKGDRISVGFDYGPFTTPTKTCWEGYLNCRLVRPILDGKPANIFISQMTSRTPSLGPVLYGVTVEVERFDHGNRLSFHASSHVAADTTNLRLIAYSIEFMP